ncbi:MAG: phosphoenolpyruvate synthase [Caldilineae bacterium]|nr:phosphoenolpyruvate synthase [Caldilineae bacterium]
MQTYVLRLEDIDPARIDQVGGKAASLAALTRIDGVRVPDGFCVTTAAFAEALAARPAIGAALERLAALEPADREGIRAAGAALRDRIAGGPIPDAPRAAILAMLDRLGPGEAYAVRSSATAEDLPAAAFAGQQDSFLNVVGAPAILERIRACWASLFSERALAYRLRQGIDPRRVAMAVVVQRLVAAEAAGTLFTADPLNGNRKLSSIEAGYGLGEAMLSGQAPADRYRLREGRIVERSIARKALATRARAGGGTAQVALAPERRDRAVLSDAQVLRLERLGRRIEAQLGRPQDIEWCLADDAIHVVQSRPITTLYPIPDAGAEGNRVFISVGHQQMMTDAMKPLGLSLFQLTAGRPMYEAGGRLFVDPTPELSAPASRAAMLALMGRSDPLIQDAIATVLAREGFIPTATAEAPAPHPASGGSIGAPAPIDDDPAIVVDLIQGSQAAIEATRTRLEPLSGVALLDAILEDVQVLRQGISEPRNVSAVMAGINAAAWINAHMRDWLGETNAADALSQAAPNNISARMGLDLLDVADAIRPHPEVVAYLRRAEDAGFWEGLTRPAGGSAAGAALRAFLDRYGMRCPGEIDVTRPRWSERPTLLVPTLLGHVEGFEPGAAARRQAQGLRAAEAKAESLLARLRALPEGAEKADAAGVMIHRLRTFIGYREYPKYAIVCRYFVYRQALLAEAERLRRAGILAERSDIDYLTLPELRELVRTGALDADQIRQRRAAHAANRKLRPPRVITSEGEVVEGAYRRADLPAGALAGLAVSAGRVEGRARVLHDMSEAELSAGDILVTPFTDPSWTPVFVTVAGLVTEVGGLMTHGAVVAREYGLPAVVGVERATERIRDGQWIRVDGSAGYVELLAERPPRADAPDDDPS